MTTLILYGRLAASKLFAKENRSPILQIYNYYYNDVHPNIWDYYDVEFNLWNSVYKYTKKTPTYYAIKYLSVNKNKNRTLLHCYNAFET